jgi:hypothetical protein
MGEGDGSHDRNEVPLLRTERLRVRQAPVAGQVLLRRRVHLQPVQVPAELRLPRREEVK